MHCSWEKEPQKGARSSNTSAGLSFLLCFWEPKSLHVPQQEPQPAAAAAWGWAAPHQCPQPQPGSASMALTPHYPQIPQAHCSTRAALKAFPIFALLKAFYFQQGNNWGEGDLQPPGDSVPWLSHGAVLWGMPEYPPAPQHDEHSPQSPSSLLQLIQCLIWASPITHRRNRPTPGGSPDASCVEVGAHVPRIE